MHRCFVDYNVGTSKEILVTGDEAKHICRVLRLAEGDKLEVCDGSGLTYPAEVLSTTKSEVKLSLGQGITDETEPKTKVYLFSGLTKGSKMDLVIQKAVELGASYVVPVETEFAVAKEGKSERWQRIAFEACKQCKRPKVPKVYDSMSLDDALNLMSQLDLSICAYEREDKQGIKDVLKDTSVSTLGIFIGPEGGFSEREIIKLKENGVNIVSLGKRILRTETASIATLTIVMHILGELE